QATTGGPARYAQAHPTGARRLLRRFRQTSQGLEGGCVVGRLFAGRSQQPLAPESWYYRKFFPGGSRRALGPAIRYRVQRDTEQLHSEYIRGIQHLSGTQSENRMGIGCRGRAVLTMTKRI